jgi:hypothetical protein
MKNHYVLQVVNHASWYKGMSTIGPRFTDDFNEAFRFDSLKDAMQSSVYSHPLCNVEPVEVEESK